MLKATERDVAQSMMRLWGPDAAQLASEYAASHRLMRNHDEAAKWQCVQHLIVQIRNRTAMLVKNSGAAARLQ